MFSLSLSLYICMYINVLCECRERINTQQSFVFKTRYVYSLTKGWYIFTYLHKQTHTAFSRLDWAKKNQ